VTREQDCGALRQHTLKGGCAKHQVVTTSLDAARLSRLARSMGLTQELKAWQARKRKYDADPDVRENNSKDLEM
jgi:hypothetical protein